MSDAFLNKMSAKQYNEYHKELFGDEWEDVKEKVCKICGKSEKKHYINLGFALFSKRLFPDQHQFEVEEDANPDSHTLKGGVS